jgi:putative heme-binding domain-containing protein
MDALNSEFDMRRRVTLDTKEMVGCLAFCLGIFLGGGQNSPTFAQPIQDPASAPGRQAVFVEQMPEVAPTQAASGAAEDGDRARLRTRALREGPKPLWIWGTNADERYVIRTRFVIGELSAAWLAASCDNSMSIELNGQRIGESDAWEEGLVVDLRPSLRPGENELRFHVANHGGIAGLVAKLALIDPQGKITTLESGVDWQVAPRTQLDAFQPATKIATYGDGPWGNVLSAERASQNSRFNALPGFAIERLFRVPKDEMGSWVAITCDPQGRLIASDQESKGLYRITPPEPGSDQPTRVERLSVDISAAQGLLFAFDSLYVCVNGGRGSGLYRLKDTNGDDQFDEVTLLKKLRGGGEHGPHALRLAPDGQSIYVCCGNHTAPPADRIASAAPQTMGGARSEPLRARLPEGLTSRIAPVWDEDLLLPRQWDANGHAAGVLAPGGWIAKTDPNGENWELVSIGYRNQYDFAFDSAGEMFAYDADMEWDMGTPWYRPTRVVHATSGSEFGWRSGTGKWPAHYVDSLPSLVDIGPGSPVGVEFGTGARFPQRYQRALFVCDWTFGTMYAIHPQAAGASYTATKEEFLSRTPLPLTDVVIGRDGHMYFTVGGRGTQSELYRVRYEGTESVAPAAALELTAEQRLRRELEQFHAESIPNAEGAVPQLITGLAHGDRHIRYAARVGLERLPPSFWVPKILASSDPQVLITGGAALARVGDPAVREPLLDRLGGIAVDKLSRQQRLELTRTLQLILIRLGSLDEKLRWALIERIDPLFPSADEALDRELVNLLAYLDSPSLPGKVVPMLERERRFTEADFTEILQRNRGYGTSIAAMLDNQPDLQQFHLAFALRNVRSGWTLDQRTTYFQWFQKAQGWKGGASYEKFLANTANDAFALCSDHERFVLEALGVRKPAALPKELPIAEGPGRKYTTEEIAAWFPDRLKDRDLKRGKQMYAAARCVVCHRYGGEGGATGPDLTQVAGRFSPTDLVDSIVRPSQVISDQYKTVAIQTVDGNVFTGRIVNDIDGKLTLVTDPEDATKTVTLDRNDIEVERISTESQMPAELLDRLNEDEVLDLLAYLLSRGQQ